MAAGWEMATAREALRLGRVVMMILGSTVGVYSSPLAGFPNFCNANLLHAGRTDDWWADEQKREKEMKKRENQRGNGKPVGPVRAEDGKVRVQFSRDGGC